MVGARDLAVMIMKRSDVIARPTLFQINPAKLLYPNPFVLLDSNGLLSNTEMVAALRDNDFAPFCSWICRGVMDPKDHTAHVENFFRKFDGDSDGQLTIQVQHMLHSLYAGSTTNESTT